MRQRTESRLRKAVRRAGHGYPDFNRCVSRYERPGRSLSQAVHALVADRSAGKWRQFAAELLVDACRQKTAYRPLLEQFMEFDGEFPAGLVPTQKILDRRGIDLLIAVLRNGSEYHRLGVVRSLMYFRGRPARRALILALEDRTASEALRALAADALSWHGGRETAEACIRALGDPSAQVRFQTVYTLEQIAAGRPSLRAIVIPALKRMTTDNAVFKGRWSVGQEARGMLHGEDAAEDERMQSEIQAILANPNASLDDRRWAVWYRRA